MYVLDEEKTIIGGSWEGYLEHEKVNQGSIMIYTGKKLSGERLSNYSITSDGGKTRIRLNVARGNVYVTYEVMSEALPSSAVQIETPPTISVENEKADKVYVDMELLKKANKISTYTKQETLKIIEENGGNISVIDGGSFV